MNQQPFVLKYNIGVVALRLAVPILFIVLIIRQAVIYYGGGELVPAAVCLFACVLIIYSHIDVFKFGTYSFYDDRLVYYSPVAASETVYYNTCGVAIANFRKVRLFMRGYGVAFIGDNGERIEIQAKFMTKVDFNKLISFIEQTSGMKVDLSRKTNTIKPLKKS